MMISGLDFPYILPPLYYYYNIHTQDDCSLCVHHDAILFCVIVYACAHRNVVVVVVRPTRTTVSTATTATTPIGAKSNFKRND